MKRKVLILQLGIVLQISISVMAQNRVFPTIPYAPISLENDDFYPSRLSGTSTTTESFTNISKETEDEGGGGESYVYYQPDNRTLEEIMEEELKIQPTRDPFSIAIPMTLIYSVILLSGLIGNISTCYIIAKISYMHTATNYYLFSLAMSDLLLLISGLPQEIYHIWIKYPYIFGEAFCVIRGLAAETSVNASVLTITAFTVERFVAIVYPLKSHLLSQLSRVIRMIGVIWVVAFCLALPQAAQFGVIDQMSRYDPTKVLIKGAWCTLVREIFPYAFQISICVFFVIPMTIITVLYVLIGLNLRKSRKGPTINRGSQELNVEARTQNRASQSHVIRMLIAVVVGFFTCWAPFHAQRLMALYGKSQTQPPGEVFMKIYRGLNHISGILYYISTCINPIFYHIMSNKFRQAFKDTMNNICNRNTNNSQVNRTLSATSHRSGRFGVHYISHRPTRQQMDLLQTIAETEKCRRCSSDRCSCPTISTNSSPASLQNNSSNTKYLLRASFKNGRYEHQSTANQMGGSTTSAKESLCNPSDLGISSLDNRSGESKSCCQTCLPRIQVPKPVQV